MLPSHLKSAPNSKYIGKEAIDIKTLDALFGDLCKTAKNVYMKIDTQGFESKVLKWSQLAGPQCTFRRLLNRPDNGVHFNEPYEHERLYSGSN